MLEKGKSEPQSEKSANDTGTGLKNSILFHKPDTTKGHEAHGKNPDEHSVADQNEIIRDCNRIVSRQRASLRSR
jgi:hypothetical protein